MRTPVSHIVLYVLSLFQTVCTVLFYTVEAPLGLTQNFFCTSVFVTLWFNEFVFTLLEAIILSVWSILRISLLILGVIGFWHRLPRRIALILLAITTGWELIWSFLFAALVFPPFLLTAVMAALCIKGFSDLKDQDWEYQQEKMERNAVL